MRRLIAVTATVLTVSLAGAGIASAAGSGPSKPRQGNTPKNAAAAAAGPEERLLKNAVHAELVVMQPSGGTKTITIDRGKVVSVAADEITIERRDGVEVTKSVTSKTVFNGMPKDKLEPGTAVLVVSEGDAATRVVSRGGKGEAAERKQALAKACENVQRPALARACKQRVS